MWSTSNRRSDLPDGWASIRQRILRRDHGRCVLCGRPGNQVDHIRPGGDHSDANLRTLCAEHHKAKSSSEGGRAVHKGKRRPAAKTNRQRPPEQHPGMK